MIKRLKIKFIALALSALFLLLALIVTGMNLLNYNEIVRDADVTLSILPQDRGEPPANQGQGEPPADQGQGEPPADQEQGMAPEERPLPPGMSPETPFESRFFSVLVNESGEITAVETSRIAAVDEEAAVRYANAALQKSGARGFVGDFRYLRAAEAGGTRLTFLDCGRKLSLFWNFVAFSVGISLLGYAVTAVLICFFAGRFIRPVAESYEKQKRFITDAGHEIKTPLTIINANADLLKMDLGENEYLDDIENQVKRLSGLTNDLVSLARMEETQKLPQMIDFPASEIVLETAAPFQTLAKAQSKELSLRVQPGQSLRGNEKEISRLVSILLDNALKYSPEKSRILLTFEKQGRKTVLTVENPCAAPIAGEDLRRVFDRFWRADPSRNSQTGGHGIGLSMAQAIVTAHGGRIAATSHNGNDFIITAVFPA